MSRGLPDCCFSIKEPNRGLASQPPLGREREREREPPGPRHSGGFRAEWGFELGHHRSKPNRPATRITMALLVEMDPFGKAAIWAFVST